MPHNSELHPLLFIMFFKTLFYIFTECCHPEKSVIQLFNVQYDVFIKNWRNPQEEHPVTALIL